MCKAESAPDPAFKAQPKGETPKVIRNAKQNNTKAKAKKNAYFSTAYKKVSSKPKKPIAKPKLKRQIQSIESGNATDHSPRALSISNPARGIRAAMHPRWACCLTLLELHCVS